MISSSQTVEMTIDHAKRNSIALSQVNKSDRKFPNQLSGHYMLGKTNYNMYL